MHGLLIALIASAAGDAVNALPSDAGEPALDFPVIPPALDVRLGFRVFDVEGAASAMEYGDTRMFATAAAELTSYTETQRLNMSAHLESPTDYGADLAYWRGDLLYARALVSGVRHNVIDVGLAGFGGSERYGVAVEQEVERPHVDVSRVDLVARLRVPGYPAHGYVRGRLVSRRTDATEQILGGSGFWDDLTRTTIAAAAETLTTNLRAGANAHLGPIELQLEHSEYWLDRRSEPLRFDYSTVDGSSGPIFVHNHIPRVRGRRDELKVHTTYTGRIAASAAAARQTRRNETIDVGETAWSANARLRWVPVAGFVMAARYNYRDVSYDTPATVPLRDLAGGAVTSFDIKPPVDATTHTFNLLGRYRPVRPVALRASWRRMVRERHNGDIWKLPARGMRDIVSGELRYDLSKNADLSVAYEHEENAAPAYNTDPHERNRVRSRIHWAPVEALTVHVEHELSFDHLDESRFGLLDTQVTAAGADRVTNNIYTLVHLIPDPSFVLSGSFAFLHYAHDPTLALQTFSHASPGFDADAGASYAEEVYIGSLSVVHAIGDVELRASGVYSRGRAVLRPSLDDALEPISIGRVARTSVTQTHVEVGVVWPLPDEWRLELDGRWDDVRFGNQAYNPRRNSRVYGGALSVGKRW